MSQKEESIYERYARLHLLWSGHPDYQAHLTALPSLVAAEFVAEQMESNANRVINILESIRRSPARAG